MLGTRYALDTVRCLAESSDVSVTMTPGSGISCDRSPRENFTSCRLRAGGEGVKKGSDRNDSYPFESDAKS